MKTQAKDKALFGAAEEPDSTPVAPSPGASSTAEYRLLVGRHGRFENGVHKIYVEGDRLRLTSAEVAFLGARVGPPNAKTPRELALEAAEAKAASPASKANRGGL